MGSSLCHSALPLEELYILGVKRDTALQLYQLEKSLMLDVTLFIFSKFGNRGAYVDLNRRRVFCTQF